MSLDAVPTPEEYALFREAYAETYPVRLLLNAVDRLSALLAELEADRNYWEEMARFPATRVQIAEAMQIGDTHFPVGSSLQVVYDRMEKMLRKANPG